MEAMQVLDTPFDVDADVCVDGDDGLGGRVVAAYQGVTAATLGLFDLIAEMDTTEAFLPRYQNTAVWLRWHLGVKASTARLYVRLARGLSQFPQFRSTFAAGSMSVDQLHILLRVATVDNQHQLVDLVAGSSDIDQLTEQITAIQDQPDDIVEPPEGPRVRTWWRDDTLRVDATIGGVDGIMVERALLRLGAQTPKDPHTGLYRHADDRMGDALVQMASESLANDGDHDRATIVVHIPAADLVNQSGDGWDAANRIFTAAELQRLACDSRLQPALHDHHGTTIGVGRTTRTIEGWLRRLVEGRDQRCRFPGCDQTRWLHSHHIVSWSQGGPTNLVSLCGFHHRLIHRHNWTITANPHNTLQFNDRHSHTHSPAPNPFHIDATGTLNKRIDHQAKTRTHQLAGTAAPP